MFFLHSIQQFYHKSKILFKRVCEICEPAQCSRMLVLWRIHGDRDLREEAVMKI